MNEIIECAAIKLNGKIHALERPNRHHNIIHMLFDETGIPVRSFGQGFLTSRGRFVLRDEALVIAKSSGQVGEKLIGSILTSEDMW